MKIETKIKKAKKILEDIWRITDETEDDEALHRATDAIRSYIRELEYSMKSPAKCEQAHVIKSVCPVCGSKKWITENNYCECTECMTKFRQTVL